MKKLVSAALVIFSLASISFAQVTTNNAGLSVTEDRIRTSEEGLASEEFRRGVQAYYKGAFNEAIVISSKR